MNEFSQTTVQSKILRLCLPQSSCKVNMHSTTFMSSYSETPEDSGAVDIVSRSRWPRNASSLLGCLARSVSSMYHGHPRSVLMAHLVFWAASL